MGLPIPFDNPNTYPGHSGVDYPQRQGTLFRASDSGYVISLGSNSRGGNYIWVKYDSIVPEVGYHHLPNHDNCPAKGTRFEYADVLGAVGSTGNSDGPHLHSEVAGHGTTNGYWEFFDSSKVIGQSGSTISKPEVKDEEMDFINIQGKAGSHSAGTFAIYRGNNDGVLYARRLTRDTLTPGIPVLPHEALPGLQATMPFVDL